MKREIGFYLKVKFSKTVGIAELNKRAIAVDIYENNVVFGSEERVSDIKTTCFLKEEDFIKA